MKISHAFRGEEWLPSAPVHLLLWKYLGWEKHMPQWAHLPLILKPDGHGKLSKRDGDRLGFPVFAMNWTDPRTNETAGGFREMGFLPEAFVNLLAVLGWNDGTEQELFSMDELVKKFSISRVHKGGAKFDFEKAKWFNHQYIQQKTEEELLPLVTPFIQQHLQTALDQGHLRSVIALIKDRCTLLSDFWQQGHFLFATPEMKELPAVQEKWNEQKKQFFISWIDSFATIANWTDTELETSFNDCLLQHGLKKGDALLPLRIMLVGAKYGPGVFHIAELIGKIETMSRIRSVIESLK
jgi:glutamyl-tRNA synthetase